MSADRSSLWGSPRSPQQLGSVIAARRHQLDLTQTSLAAQAGVPRRFVNDLEGGQTTMYVQRLFATLDALGYRMVLEVKDETPEIQAPAMTDVGW